MKSVNVFKAMIVIRWKTYCENWIDAFLYLNDYLIFELKWYMKLFKDGNEGENSVTAMQQEGLESDFSAPLKKEQYNGNA